MEKIVGEVICAVTPVHAGSDSVAAANHNKLFHNKNVRNAAIIAGVVVVAAGAGYAWKASTYNERFMPASIINGIDMTELTQREAEEQIRQQVENYALTIRFADGSEETIQGKDIDLTYVTDDQLQQLIADQPTWKWAASVFGGTHEQELKPRYTYNPLLLRYMMRNLPPMKDESVTRTSNAHMQYDEEKKEFALIPEVCGNEYDENKVLDSFHQMIEEFTPEIAVDEDYYVKPTVYADDKELNQALEDANAFLQTRICLQLYDGSEYVIDAERLVDWLEQDKDHPERFAVNEEKIRQKAEETVAILAETEDRTLYSFPFQSTNSGIVNVSCSPYTRSLDHEAEVAQLMKDVMAGGEITRKPIYAEDNGVSIGDTYIEVDIRNQTVYMYKNGKMIFEGACVSGTDVSADRRSDRGLFHIYKKLKDHTMLGPIDPKTGKPSYASPTRYASYYNGGEAFHDAPWRSSFGGKTYIRSGSHGCINMSYASAKTIYENCEIGTPVIVFGSTKH